MFDRLILNTTHYLHKYQTIVNIKDEILKLKTLIANICMNVHNERGFGPLFGS